MNMVPSVRALLLATATLGCDPIATPIVALDAADAGVDDAAVANDADFIGVEDAGGNDVKRELAQFVDYGVAGVISGRVAGNNVGFFSQQIDDPALALVPPLAAHDN